MGQATEHRFHIGGGKPLIDSLIKQSKGYLRKHFINDDLDDYKFYCFDGRAECVMVCTGRAEGEAHYYFFDRNWQLCRINRRGKDAPHNFTLPKPPNLEKMFEVAETLSSGIPHLRVDLYNVNGHIYFGELTFFTQSGFDRGLLPETDRQFGDMIHCNVPPKKQVE